MSEPCSLYAKITIRPEQFAAFLATPCAKPVANASWQAWWDSREMCGKADLKEELYPIEAINQPLIEQWLCAEYAIAASVYDAEKEIWHFSVNEFSENYGSVVDAAIFLQGIAPFKEDNPEDFVVVYDFFYGGDVVMASMSFKEGQIWFDPAISEKAHLDPEKLAQADAYLQQQWEIYDKTRDHRDD